MADNLPPASSFVFNGLRPLLLTPGTRILSIGFLELAREMEFVCKATYLSNFLYGNASVRQLFGGCAKTLFIEILNRRNADEISEQFKKLWFRNFGGCCQIVQ